MAQPAAIIAAMLAAAWLAPAAAQPAAEEFRVSGDHPRLFLQARRLRFLERERERQSLRWRQFQALVEGKAAMPEPGFAWALYARVSGQPALCRDAVRWALSPGADLRQSALVFDWCQPELTTEDSRALSAALERGAAWARKTPGVAAVRDRALAAVALAGHREELAARELRSVIQDWWRGQIVPALEGAGDPVAPGDLFALMEILHAVKDNLDIDLRDPVKSWFHDLPLVRLFHYVPAPFPGAENDFYLPADGAAVPDLRRAALARAADLALVALDANTQPAGFLQGWLMRDTLLMRGPFGIPYELLWANPYQPGLSFHHAPRFYHDRRLGRLCVRSGWDDEAAWLQYRDGGFLQSAGGAPRDAAPPPANSLVRLGGVGLYRVAAPATRKVPGAELPQVFLIGLNPGEAFEISVGGRKPTAQTAGPGGIIGLAFEKNETLTVRLRARRQ
jgi:hypothetical protein